MWLPAGANGHGVVSTGVLGVFLLAALRCSQESNLAIWLFRPAQWKPSLPKHHAEDSRIERLYRINGSPSLAGWHITTLSILLGLFAKQLTDFLFPHCRIRALQIIADEKRFECRRFGRHQDQLCCVLA
jgi:hypothetical protein